MKRIYPIILLFVLVNLLVWGLKSVLLPLDYDTSFVLIANLLLFLMTVVGFRIVSGRTGKNIHGFMRGVYLSFLLKMLVIIGALFIFMSISKNINKPALFISLGLYVVYTAVEVSLLMKMVRNHKNE